MGIHSRPGDTMTTPVPIAETDTTFPPALSEAPRLEGPADLVEAYLELVEQRRVVEEKLAYVKAELELVAAAHLNDRAPRGRFVSARGAISARLQPTCVFDRPAVMKELQRAGRLADVASVSGPQLARFLAKEPVLAARLGEMVRKRSSVVLMATSL